MGHRALVAYQTGADEYNLYYSHWGAARLKLKNRITPETPYGDGAVDPDPWDHNIGVSLSEIVNHQLQYRDHEAFYRVSETYDVEAWAVVSIGFHDEFHPDEPRRGVCVPISFYQQDGTQLPRGLGRHRGWVEGIRDAAHSHRDDHESAIGWVTDQVYNRFQGARSRGGDHPVLSTERPIPSQYQGDRHQLSDAINGI